MVALCDGVNSHVRICVRFVAGSVRFVTAIPSSSKYSSSNLGDQTVIGMECVLQPNMIYKGRKRLGAMQVRVIEYPVEFDARLALDDTKPLLDNLKMG